MARAGRRELDRASSTSLTIYMLAVIISWLNQGDDSRNFNRQGNWSNSVVAASWEFYNSGQAHDP